ncbi:MAG: hypothetical protein ACP59X_10130 [Solidesulfovibrio sp. DCME]|uniref:hypothetical protein n=1 Tax=Solidesulfovibrio sp. DCME TaxID=3447380 RepID=UPI003D0D318C
MSRRPVFSLLVACCLALWPLAVSAQTDAPIGPGAVWQPSGEALTACLGQSAEPAGCLVRVMAETGASPEALDVTKRLDGEGYLQAFRDTGRVDVATVVFPLRANSNEVAYLVNGQPRLVSSELDEDALPLAGNARYAALKKAYPEVLFWPVGEGPRSVETLPDGGQGFVFGYALLNGCHACEVLGQAVVSLDFGPDGRYHGPRLVGVEAAP